jgi:NAD(P)-dependent dehydrogenase (short-subunit alcohol dehydrogenase family)
MGFKIDLSGQRALVTGAAQGVGFAIASALGAAGATVIVNDIRPEAAADATGRLRAEGCDAEALPFDVTAWSEVSGAIEGGAAIDILVNNAGNAGAAGFAGITEFADSDPHDWNRYISVNLFGVMNCTRAALPGMIAGGGGGRIVTIVSDAGRYGDAKLAPYAAAKAGAAGFCRSVAREVGRHAITVNCVSLGTIVTPATARPEPETPEAHAAEKSALRPYVIRRRGVPGDVAGLVTFLVSSHAAWITGQTYPVNGGYTFSL